MNIKHLGLVAVGAWVAYILYTNNKNGKLMTDLKNRLGKAETDLQTALKRLNVQIPDKYMPDISNKALSNGGIDAMVRNYNTEPNSTSSSARVEVTAGAGNV